MDTVDVVLAHHWRDHRECCPGGKIQAECPYGEDRKPNEELSLSDEFARSLVDAGVANWASEADALVAGGDRARVAKPAEQQDGSRAALAMRAKGLGVEIDESWDRKRIAQAIVDHEAARAEPGDGLPAKAELIAQAESLGVEVKKSWTRRQIAEAIAERGVPGQDE